jgi:hypothetical protein
MNKKIFFIALLIMTGMILGLIIFYLPKATATPANARYVPDKRCYLCHKEQAKSHIKDKHANSFKSLTDNNQEDNLKCLICHTTGYGKPGGFVDKRSTPELKDVGCQACHGPGSAHVELGLSKEQKRQTIDPNVSNSCLKCHEIHKEHIDIKKR